MALIHCDIYSSVLGKDVGVYVVLPEHRDIKNKSRKLKTLFLLHGITDDYTKWIRRTPIERYAKQNDWAVIMPDCEKGFYSNGVKGKRYWDFISDELPKTLYALFPLLSTKPDDTFVAGLSMGGFGSLKLALNFPERFKAAASFSGALNVYESASNPEHKYKYVYERVFGTAEMIKNSENDLYYLVKELKKQNKKIPEIYLTCGTDDSIFNVTKSFNDYLKELEVNCVYEYWQGDHDWDFWDESIKRALKWFNAISN